MKRIRTAEIMGRPWAILWTHDMPEDRVGECEVSPGLIRIRPNLGQRGTLEVLIHEALHAANWAKSEAVVTRLSADLAEILWRAGWRPRP